MRSSLGQEEAVRTRLQLTVRVSVITRSKQNLDSRFVRNQSRTPRVHTAVGTCDSLGARAAVGAAHLGAVLLAGAGRDEHAQFARVDAVHAEREVEGALRAARAEPRRQQRRRRVLTVKAILVQRVVPYKDNGKTIGLSFA